MREASTITAAEAREALLQKLRLKRDAYRQARAAAVERQRRRHLLMRAALEAVVDLGLLKEVEVNCDVQ